MARKDKQEIPNPFATFGSADNGTSERSETQTVSSSNAQKARMLEVQTSRLPKAERKQHTVYLSLALSKWVKLQAIEEEREISMIVEQALEEYRNRQKGNQVIEAQVVTPAPVVEQKRVEVETLPSADLISLQAFADLHAINRNEAERLWRQGLIAGEKQGTGRQQTIMLGAKGRRDFWTQFHETPGFRACNDCPHKGT